MPLGGVCHSKILVSCLPHLARGRVSWSVHLLLPASSCDAEKRKGTKKEAGLME